MEDGGFFGGKVVMLAFFFPFASSSAAAAAAAACSSSSSAFLLWPARCFIIRFRGFERSRGGSFTVTLYIYRYLCEEYTVDARQW